MKTTISVTFLLAIALFFGCSKSSTTTPTVSKATLVPKTWNVQEVDASINALALTAYVKGGTSNLIDFSKYQVTFSSDGSYKQTDQTGSKTSGTWQLTNNEANLVMTDGTTKVVATWDINTLADASFVMKHNIDGTNPTSFDTLIIQYAQKAGYDATKNSTLTLKLAP